MFPTDTHRIVAGAPVTAFLLVAAVACGGTMDDPSSTSPSESSDCAAAKCDGADDEGAISTEIALETEDDRRNLKITGDLAETLDETIDLAETKMGYNLRESYSENVRCEEGSCTVFDVAEPSRVTDVLAPGVRFQSDDRSGVYYVNSLLSNAGYEKGRGRIRCEDTGAGFDTACTFAFEPAETTDVGEEIQVRAYGENRTLMTATDAAATTLRDLFVEAQRHAEHGRDLSDEFGSGIVCQEPGIGNRRAPAPGGCRVAGIDEVTTDGASATLRASGESNGLYYLLEMMVLAEQGEVDGASFGDFSCRYRSDDDETVCEIDGAAETSDGTGE